LRVFDWADLCKKGVFKKTGNVMTSTSGSTGAPFYFPRNDMIDLQSSYCHEIFLRNLKITKKNSVLVIDCFGMGVWIGGLITYQAFKYIQDRGYSVTIITPGINKHEIFQALKNIAPLFDVVILCGYPPFIKDVIDEGESNKIIWEKFPLKIIFAAGSKKAAASRRRINGQRQKVNDPN
jgi:phenylacetate-CoA ligase